MRFLERERAALTKLLPGLDESLRAVPLMALEGPRSPGIRLFRESGGPGLLAPAAFRGRGATALSRADGAVRLPGRPAGWGPHR